MEQPNVPAVGRRNANRGMAGFRANFEGQVPQSQDFFCTAPTNMGTGAELFFLTPDQADAYATRFVNTNIAECNKADDPHQSSAYFLGAIACIFPGVASLAREIFGELGYSLTMVNETTAAANFIDILPWIDTSSALAAVGQLILILFKNIDERSYGRFIQNRAAALKYEAGMIGTFVPESGTDVLLSIEKAKNIRTILGGSARLRAAILKIILANREGQGRVNRICKYLADILSWNEMSELVIICEELLLTNSPVLNHPRVQNEVLNLYEIFRKVTEATYPQYFRILHPTEAGVLMVRARYSTLADLAEVARRCRRSDLNSTVNQFAGASETMTPLVRSLLAIHREHIGTANMPAGAAGINDQ